MKKGKTKKELNKKAKRDKDFCGAWNLKKECKNCGGVYFLGFIGAVIYYIQTSTSFWNGVLGILKAIVWPAMLVYKLLTG